MENATKILLISVGTLIAILIVSWGMQNAKKLTGTADAYESRVNSLNLRKYNHNFESFADRNDVTAQEIVTLIGFVQKNDNYTRIYVENRDVSQYNEQEKNDFLRANPSTYDLIEDEGELKKVMLNSFSCSYGSIVYDSSGYIVEIRFEKNEMLSNK